MSKAEVEDLYKVSTRAWACLAVPCSHGMLLYCEMLAALVLFRWFGCVQEHSVSNAAAECLVGMVQMQGSIHASIYTVCMPGLCRTKARPEAQLQNHSKGFAAESELVDLMHCVLRHVLTGCSAR
jgi:hypothetical protein